MLVSSQSLVQGSGKRVVVKGGAYTETIVNCGPRGGTGGAKPSSGQFGVSETPSQRPLRAPERLSGPRGRLFRGLGEVCSFSTERENKVGHSEAPKRPIPLRGFQPSGSYPWATDKIARNAETQISGSRKLGFGKRGLLEKGSFELSSKKSIS